MSVNSENQSDVKLFRAHGDKPEDRQQLHIRVSQSDYNLLHVLKFFGRIPDMGAGLLMMARGDIAPLSDPCWDGYREKVIELSRLG